MQNFVPGGTGICKVYFVPLEDAFVFPAVLGALSVDATGALRKFLFIPTRLELRNYRHDFIGDLSVNFL